MSTVRYTRSFTILNDGASFFRAEGIIEEVSESKAAGLVRGDFAVLLDEVPTAHDDEVAAADDDIEIKRPYGNAAKSAWIEYGVTQGGDEEELSGLTKAELQSRYGERL